jgi:cell wall-associated NlpC family hydrolase
VKALAAGIGVVALIPLALGGAAMVAGAAGQADVQAVACTSSAGITRITRQISEILDGAGTKTVRVPGLSDPAEQIPNAQTIVATGAGLQVPARGQTIALATALQESGLRNLSSGDRDSLGLFQQRPSQGWGTAQQILDPVYASQQFYEHLLAVPGWEQMTLTQAAQAVQRSAFPGAYAKWEALATALQQAIAKALPTGSAGTAPSPADGTAGCASDDGSQYGTIPDGSVPTGYSIPASADPRAREAIEWAMRQLGTPYQWGGSCTDANGPDPMGRCDCSSLVQQSYAHAGITLPRTTYQQIHAGKKVTGPLRPGDLLFEDGTATHPSHVGMYIGDGLVIEAPHTGAVVRIGPLKDWTVLATRRVV